MKTALLAITRHGIALACKLQALQPETHLYLPEKFATETLDGTAHRYSYAGKTAGQLAGLFKNYDALICIVSLGAVVRLIAPHLGNKETDPAIIVIDEAGQFVIPVLSGHQGGANQLAGELAQKLGATAVLTTASDARQTLAVDLLGRELGWQIVADHASLLHASAAMVNHEAVAMVQEAGSKNWWLNHANGRSGPLPANLHCAQSLEEIHPQDFSALLWISSRELPAALASAWSGRLIIYRPGAQA